MSRLQPLIEQASVSDDHAATRSAPATTEQGAMSPFARILAIANRALAHRRPASARAGPDAIRLLRLHSLMGWGHSITVGRADQHMNLQRVGNAIAAAAAPNPRDGGAVC